MISARSTVANSAKLPNKRIEADLKVPPKELTPRANSSEVESGKSRSSQGFEVR